MSNQQSHNEYNSEPVAYCAKCYSLKISNDESIGECYCLNCGSTDIVETSIEDWENLYEKRYGSKFLSQKRDPRNTIYFKMSMNELKNSLFNSIYFEDILKELYQNVPDNLTKIERLLWLFNKLEEDNRLDELRLSLLKYSRK